MQQRQMGQGWLSPFPDGLYDFHEQRGWHTGKKGYPYPLLHKSTLTSGNLDLLEVHNLLWIGHV